MSHYLLASAYPRRWNSNLHNALNNEHDYSSLEALVFRRGVTSATTLKREPSIELVLNEMVVGQCYTVADLSSITGMTIDRVRRILARAHRLNHPLHKVNKLPVTYVRSR